MAKVPCETGIVSLTVFVIRSVFGRLLAADADTGRLLDASMERIDEVSCDGLGGEREADEGAAEVPGGEEPEKKTDSEFPWDFFDAERRDSELGVP